MLKIIEMLETFVEIVEIVEMLEIVMKFEIGRIRIISIDI